MTVLERYAPRRAAVRAAFMRGARLADAAAERGVPFWVAGKWSSLEGGWSRRRRAACVRVEREIGVRATALNAVADIEGELRVSRLVAIRELAARVALIELEELQRRAAAGDASAGPCTRA